MPLPELLVTFRCKQRSVSVWHSCTATRLMLSSLPQVPPRARQRSAGHVSRWARPLPINSRACAVGRRSARRTGLAAVGSVQVLVLALHGCCLNGITHMVVGVPHGSQVLHMHSTRNWEQNSVLAAGGGGAKQSERVRSLFHRQLQVPLTQGPAAMAAYKEWEAGGDVSSGCSMAGQP